MVFDVGSFMTLAASLSLFKSALSHVLASPISMFDTTPIGEILLYRFHVLLLIEVKGRILSRFSRDQDIMDDDLPMMSFQVRTFILPRFVNRWTYSGLV